MILELSFSSINSPLGRLRELRVCLACLPVARQLGKKENCLTDIEDRLHNLMGAFLLDAHLALVGLRASESIDALELQFYLGLRAAQCATRTVLRMLSLYGLESVTNEHAHRLATAYDGILQLYR